MSKTIAEKAVEMAEANSALTAQVATHVAHIESLTAQVTDLTAKASAFESDKTTLNNQITALTVERDALAAQIATLSNTLAITPQVAQSDGVAPVKDATPKTDEVTVQTWQQALASCGGNYVTARAKYPAVFDAYIESHKDDKK